MGKLHTLRRAIKRRPKRWVYQRYGLAKANGAHIVDGEWQPIEWGNLTQAPIEILSVPS